MPKISYERVISADRMTVFEAVTDYESFQRTMPQYFPSVRIRSSRDNVTVVEQHIRISGRELVMMTKHIVDYPRLHEVFVIGGDAKGTNVTETYEEVSGGTKMAVRADIKLCGAMRVLGLFGRGRIARGFENIADEFVRLVQEG